MNNLTFAAIFASVLMATITFCGGEAPPPKHIFEMEDVAVVDLDFQYIPQNGQASVSVVVPDAFIGEFYMVVPILPDEAPGSDVCMDLTCDVVFGGVVTVTAYSCADGDSDPQSTKYLLKRTKR